MKFVDRIDEAARLKDALSEREILVSRDVRSQTAGQVNAH